VQVSLAAVSVGGLQGAQERAFLVAKVVRGAHGDVGGQRPAGDGLEDRRCAAFLDGRLADGKEQAG
jgi:hypothetical protein